MADELKWVKSSHSSEGGPQNCVEAASLDSGGVEVRDSKAPGGSRLAFSGQAWRAFTAAMEDNSPTAG